MNPQHMKSRQNRNQRMIDDYIIYSSSMITRSISLSIITIGENLDDTIRQKIHDEYEGKCVVEGYIRPGSSKIITYSSGIVRGGYIVFEVLFECDICLPVEGMKLKCIAVNITIAGIRANIANLKPSPAVIFITRDHHYDNEYFNTINEGDIFIAIVIGQRFELNDKFVSVIAKLETSSEYKRDVKRGRKGKETKKQAYIEENDDGEEVIQYKPNDDYYGKALSNMKMAPLKKIDISGKLPKYKTNIGEEVEAAEPPPDFEGSDEDEEEEEEEEEEEDIAINTETKKKAKIIDSDDEDVY